MRGGRGFLLLILLLFGVVPAGYASEHHVTKEKLAKKHVYSYMEQMVSGSGGRLLTVHQVVNQ